MRRKKNKKVRVFAGIEIRNLTSKQWPADFVLKTAKRIKSCMILKRSAWFEIILLERKEMRQINRKWRKKNKVTDILSFSMPKDFPGKPPFLGEIFLCPEVIKKESSRKKIVFEEELTRLLIHGILHLVGYTHETSRRRFLMERREKMVVRKIFNGSKNYICT